MLAGTWHSACCRAALPRPMVAPSRIEGPGDPIQLGLIVAYDEISGNIDTATIRKPAACPPIASVPASAADGSMVESECDAVAVG